jgi:hypothetical protein
MCRAMLLLYSTQKPSCTNSRIHHPALFLQATHNQSLTSLHMAWSIESTSSRVLVTLHQSHGIAKFAMLCTTLLLC